MCTRLRRGLSNKRYKIEDAHIDEIKLKYELFPKESKISKTIENKEFGYAQITVNRPLRRNYSFTSERIELIKTQSTYLELKS